MPAKKTLPRQRQHERPGREWKMRPRPRAVDEAQRGSGKLADKIAVITGGDSGIGRAVAVAFAKEGADIFVVYLKEHRDAKETKRLVEAHGRRCEILAGDVGDEAFCRRVAREAVRAYGRIDVLVNNAAEQTNQESIEDISREQLERTFRTNIYAMFHLTKAALRHMREGSAIMNTTSVTAYRGNPTLLDYSSTKGAIVSFTRSLSINLEKRKIRVNAVAPGPIWTPLIPSTSNEGKVERFGADTPMGRPGQPEEVAPAFVFLASDDASYVSGQVIHPNGGEVVNG